MNKDGANWRYMRGDDVRLISLGLGHGACGVTCLSYLRTVDLWQREVAWKMVCSVSLSRAKLAALLSIEDSSYVSKLGRDVHTAKTDTCGLELKSMRQTLDLVISVSGSTYAKQI